MNRESSEWQGKILEKTPTDDHASQFFRLAPTMFLARARARLCDRAAREMTAARNGKRSALHGNEYGSRRIIKRVFKSLNTFRAGVISSLRR